MEEGSVELKFRSLTLHFVLFLLDTRLNVQLCKSS